MGDSVYSRSSYKDVTEYPLDEFWKKGKPFLYCGAMSSSEKEEENIYDVLNRKPITLSGNENVFGPNYKPWPDEYTQTLKQYTWIDKRQARDHGCNPKIPLLLVFAWNAEWGLFRCSTGVFRNIYMNYLAAPNGTQLTLF